MTEEEILASIDNAWRALARRYDKEHNESFRIAMNCLAEIIAKVKTEYNEENNREEQISIDEWMKWLESEVEGE